MSQEERYGTRDRTYSAWHRRNSTRRFVGIEKAQNLALIDLDAALYVEYDDMSKEPLALIETAKDVGQDYKNAAVTKNLAKKAGIRAYVILYTPDKFNNPADESCPDIRLFRVKMLWPRTCKDWITVTPDEWAKFLVKLRSGAAAELDDSHAHG